MTQANLFEAMPDYHPWERPSLGRGFNTANTETSKDEWLTPPALIKALGEFDLDPCSPPDSRRPWPTAAKHISLPENGLRAKWEGRVWLNPPYGDKTFVWLAKLADHRRGIALIFARTETVGFHKVVWERAHSVFFFKGRLRFHHATGERGDTANAPSCLVSYSLEDTVAIERAAKAGSIKGKLVQFG